MLPTIQSKAFCLLSVGKKSKNGNMEDYNFACFLYGFETWSLTLREEHRLRLFENTVLRRIFEPKRDEVTGGWRELHNQELRDLYSSPSIIRIIKSRRMLWAGRVARRGEKRTAYTLLVVKPEGKRLLERQRLRRAVNIKMDVLE
jgi:hypothetical protein